MIYWLKNKLARHAYDLDEENESDLESGGEDDDDDDEKVRCEKNNDDEECKSNENKVENVKI